MNEKSEQAKVTRGAMRWLLRETLGNLILIAILFGIVGRWDWWNGWALSAIYILWSLGSVIFILPVNPQMLAERQLSGVKKDSKRWDLVMVSLMGVFVLATYLTACFDVRNGWSPSFAPAVQIAGGVVAVLGYDVILLRSMTANAFFNAIVRIQTDRKHTVATGGPYRFVRHPGYAGTILTHLATPFLLNSRWALIPAALVVAVLVVRTALEDRTLQAELAGYKEYAARVRYRLLPGIW
jgi:protein-S-isoprenylcysteine O-methyltransferase Ste14